MNVLLEYSSIIFTLLVSALFAFSSVVCMQLSKEEKSELFYKAITEGSKEEVRRCLDNGVDVNNFYHTLTPPLQFALMRYNGDIEIIKILLSHKDINVNDSSLRRYSSLRLALYIKDSTLVELLLKSGADPNATGNKGSPDLFYAIEQQSIKLVKLLLRYGADYETESRIDSYIYGSSFAKRTPYEYACDLGLDAIKKLLKNPESFFAKEKKKN